jgi:hypothetical protein
MAEPENHTDEPDPDDGTKTPAADTEKKFTQADVDRFIQREKAKIKPLKEENDALKKGKDETLTAYEETISKVNEGLIALYPDQVKSLLAKMTPIEQFNWMQDPANNVLTEKKQFPLSPKKGGKTPEFTPRTIEPFI